MNGGPNMDETVTVVCIIDCPTITVHTRKCYKALIDSGAAISLLWYSTYQNIEDSLKTLIQQTTAKLNTANNSPLTALGITAIHLRIKITGPVIKEYMAYFITDDNPTEGRDPNINIINDIHKIKGETSVNILVSNYTNKTHYL